MSKFHSTVTRRDFMKGLGLAGAGLSAAAATAPVFHDLDEVAASRTQTHKWWVKESDEITAEIDWDLIDFSSKTIKAPFPPGQRAKVGGIGCLAPSDKQKQGILQGQPGYTLRDRSFVDANLFVRKYMLGLLTVEGQEVITPDLYGVPRHSGSPEENLKLARAVTHFWGAPYCGSAEIDGQIGKLFSSKVRFEVCDEPYVDGKTVVIPEKCKWVITFQVLQSHVVDKHTKIAESGPFAGYMPYFGMAGTYDGYFSEGAVTARLANFIKGLGYVAIPGRACGNSPPPFGGVTGLGEIGRTGILTSPYHGNEVRNTGVIITDLPMPRTKPIDAGIFQFCRTCIICANTCPSGSLSTDSEPSWDIHSFNEQPLNRPGIRVWRNNWATCAAFGAPMECGICQAICPFSHLNESLIHSIVRATVSTVPLLNSFLASMEPLFASRDGDPEDWWNRDLSSYKHDVILGQNV